MRCIVSTCEQDFRAEDTNLVVHRFPKKEPRRQKWIDAVIEGVRRGGGLPYDLDRVQEQLKTKEPRICSAHFLPEQYVVENNHRSLKKDAYPIIFPPDVAPPLPKLDRFCDDCSRVMVIKCILQFCGNRLSLLENSTSGISGHRIPKNEPRRSRWIRAIMAGLQTCGQEFDRAILSNPSARICSAHFLPEQYTERDGGPRILERDAVPCVFKLEAPALPFRTSPSGGTKPAMARKTFFRPKSLRCAVRHCRARAEDGVSFSQVPKPDPNSVGLLANLRARQRALWETAIGRVVDLQAKNPLICSRHFIKGRKAHVKDSSDPDWVPTLNLEPPDQPKPSDQQQAANKPGEQDVQIVKTIRKMTNYEVYALIEGRVKYRHMFRYTANRETAWRSVQRSCSPVLNCFSAEQMEQKWTKLLRLYQRITGPRDSKLEYYPAEEWVHYSKMHDAMTRLKNPLLNESQPEDEPELDPAALHGSSVDVDDYYTATDKILWGKGSENRPRPSRAAQLASQPIPKRPVSLGNRTCKAIQSGNPGLQPTARPVPPPGSPDYCRLCFTNQQLEPLCSGVIVAREELLEKIYVCTGVLIIARPKESIYVCTPCAALINNFSTFRQQICSNNRALLEQLKSRNPPEIAFCEPMPPLVGTTVSSVLSQSHVVRGPTPKKIILTPPSKGVLMKVGTNTPIMVRTPQSLQKVGTPTLPTLTRAPNAPVIVKRIVYAKPGAVPIGIPPRPTEEAAIDLPEEIKTEFDDPLDGCGDSGNALVMPKPLKITAPLPPPTTLQMSVESHPAEPAVVGDSESWKCWNCEQDFPFKFECAKHLLQAHQESVANIRDRLNLDELNTNMLEMMALRASSGMAGRKVVLVKAATAPVAKRPRMDDAVVEIE